MGRIWLGFLALAASVGSASAACSTSSLAGQWVVFVDNPGCIATITTAGVITGCGGGTVAMSSACKWTATVDGQGYSGRSEALGPSSTLKPNLLIGVKNNRTERVTAFRR
jgi:hypothetical protein